MNENIKINDILIPVEGKVKIELLDDYNKPVEVVEQKNTIADKVYRDIKWVIRNYFSNGCPNNTDTIPWSWFPFSDIILLSDYFTYNPLEANFEYIASKPMSESYNGTEVNVERARRVFMFNKNEANGKIKSVLLGSWFSTVLSGVQFGFGTDILPYGATYWKDTTIDDTIYKCIVMTGPYVSGKTDVYIFYYSDSNKIIEPRKTINGINLFSITFDGTYFWLAGTGRTMYKLSSDSFETISTYNLPTAPNGIQIGNNTVGLACDGYNLWLLETTETSSWFFKLNTNNMQIMDYFEIPVKNLHGLEYYDGCIFALEDGYFDDATRSRMLKINIGSRKIIRRLVLSTVLNDITWDNKELWGTIYTYDEFSGIARGGISMEQSKYYELIDSYLNLETPIVKTKRHKMRLTYDYIFQD